MATKLIELTGYASTPNGAAMKRLSVIVTNDKIGKTISIHDERNQFTIPFEPLEKYLK